MARKSNKKLAGTPPLALSDTGTPEVQTPVSDAPSAFNPGPLLISHKPDLANLTLADLPLHHDTRPLTEEEDAAVASLLGLPTHDEIAAALAEIEPEMEHAASAGVVDHVSQIGSWTPAAVAEEQREERELEDAIAFEEGETLEVSLDQQRAAVPEDQAGRMVWSIRNEIDTREEFEIEAAEAEKGDVNPNILRTLKKVRSQMVTLRAAKLLCALQVEPGFINRSVNEGFRYNVYALGKLSDVIYGVTDGSIANAINLACLKTLFQFKRVEQTFTMEVAKGCCSKQYALKKLGAAVRAHVVSHTVSESTAPTQASSTMQALTTLGVVKCNGSGKNAVYTLTDAPIVRKLEALLAA